MPDRVSPKPIAPAPVENAAVEMAVDERIALEGRTLREHTARGAVINAAFQVGFAALGLLRRVVVAAFLTQAEFGFWGILLVTLMTLAWLKQVGVSDKYIQQTEQDQELAFQRAFTIELLYTLLFYVVVAAALPLYALAYGRPEIILPGFVLALGVLGSALHTPNWIFYRQMRFVRQRVLESVDPVVGFVVTVTLAVAGAGYWSLIIGFVVGSFTGAAASLIACPYPIRLRFDRRVFREYFSFSWPLFIASASNLIVVQGGIFVGNYAVGLAGVGAIALAASFSGFADRVSAILNRTVYPAVCAVKDRVELLRETFEKSNRLALMWAIPFGAGLALFAPDLVTYVLGERWRDSQGLLQVLGLVAALGQVAYNWTLFFAARGNTRPIAVYSTVGLATFLAAMVPLLLSFGLTGYAIGLAVVIAMQVMVRFVYLTRLFEGFSAFRHLWRAVAPSVPAVGVVLLLRLVTAGAQRSLELALLELIAYGAVTVLATLAFERSLLREVAGYLRRGARRPLPTPSG